MLNPHVNVREHSGPINKEFLSHFGAVVVTDNTIPLATLCQWDEACRTSKPAVLFLLGITSGLTATLFADFGVEHTVTDETGDAAKTGVIEGE